MYKEIELNDIQGLRVYTSYGDFKTTEVQGPEYGHKIRHDSVEAHVSRGRICRVFLDEPTGSNHVSIPLPYEHMNIGEDIYPVPYLYVELFDWYVGYEACETIGENIVHTTYLRHYRRNSHNIRTLRQSLNSRLKPYYAGTLGDGKRRISRRESKTSSYIRLFDDVCRLSGMVAEQRCIGDIMLNGEITEYESVVIDSDIYTKDKEELNRMHANLDKLCIRMQDDPRCYPEYLCNTIV